MKRNHVSRYDVARDVLIQQVIQTIVGHILGLTEPDDFSGKEEYDIAVWARRIRVAQRMVPSMLAILSIDAKSLARTLAAYPAIASALAGGYSEAETTTIIDGVFQVVPAFEKWELSTARIIYWIIVPALQFFVAISWMDTWQYFLHRAMHMNKWLYSKFGFFGR